MAVVVRWLDEAHGAGSLAAHVHAVRDGTATSPFRDVPGQVAAAARKASPDRSHGGSHGALARAEQRAVGDVLVLLELALLLRTTTMALVRNARLRLDALRWEWVARSLDTDTDDPPGVRDAHDRVMVSWGHRFDALRIDLAVHDAARRLLEARRLGGRATLFPDDEAEHRELSEAVDRVAAMAGLGPTPEPEDADVQATAHALLAQARARALDLLGRRAEAAEVIGRLLWGGE